MLCNQLVNKGLINWFIWQIEYSDEIRPGIPDEIRPLLAMDNMVQR